MYNNESVHKNSVCNNDCVCNHDNNNCCRDNNHASIWKINIGFRQHPAEAAAEKTCGAEPVLSSDEVKSFLLQHAVQSRRDNIRRAATFSDSAAFYVEATKNLSTGLHLAFRSIPTFIQGRWEWEEVPRKTAVVINQLQTGWCPRLCSWAVDWGGGGSLCCAGCNTFFPPEDQRKLVEHYLRDCLQHAKERLCLTRSIKSPIHEFFEEHRAIKNYVETTLLDGGSDGDSTSTTMSDP